MLDFGREKEGVVQTITEEDLGIDPDTGELEKGISLICPYCAKYDDGDPRIPSDGVGDKVISCPRCHWMFHLACLEKHFTEMTTEYNDERLETEELMYYDGDERKFIERPGPFPMKRALACCDWIRWMDEESDGFGV